MNYLKDLGERKNPVFIERSGTLCPPLVHMAPRAAPPFLRSLTFTASFHLANYGMKRGRAALLGSTLHREKYIQTLQMRWFRLFWCYVYPKSVSVPNEHVGKALWPKKHLWKLWLHNFDQTWFDMCIHVYYGVIVRHHSWENGKSRSHENVIENAFCENAFCEILKISSYESERQENTT